MRMQKGKVHFESNSAGGIFGRDFHRPRNNCSVCRETNKFYTNPRNTVTTKGKDALIVTKGRHDPCVGIRAVPVGEAMMACVLADHFLRHRGQCG